MDAAFESGDDAISFDQTFYKKQFDLPDFIMEAHAASSFRSFIENGGDPAVAKEILTEGYQNLPQMVNLFGCWYAELDSSEVKSSKKQAPIKANIIENSNSVRQCFEQTASSLISKVFNPDSADKIFEMDPSEGVDWLPELISHESWRKLIYELSEQYPQCLLLNFAVKLVSDAGFQHEISNVSTAAQQLDIFSRVFISYVDQVIRAFPYGENTKTFYDRFQDLAKVACHSEHSYLYTQAILRVMLLRNSNKAAAACAHIAQSLRLSAENRKHETTVLMMGLIQSELDLIPSGNLVFRAILTMISKQSLNPADVNQLYQAYFEPTPPPVELIRDPLFVDILVNSLFNANAPRLNLEYRPKYVYLLAYASCVGETLRNGIRVQTKIELDGTRDRIEELLDTLFPSDDLLPRLPKLLTMIGMPVLARSVLHNIKTTILREDFLTEPQNVHLILIDQIVLQHSNLRHSVFKMLCELYENQSARDEVAEVVMSRQRVVVDRFVHLLSTGYLPVLEWVSRMYSDGLIDVSLVRYFGIEVLDLVDEPYSDEFIKLMLPITSKSEVFDRTTVERQKQVAFFLEQISDR